MRSIASSASTNAPRLALAAFAALAVVSWLGPVHPYGWLHHLPELCLFHRFTGLDCPGCGMGRATMLLAQGQVAASWQQHPFALLGLVGLLVRMGTTDAWRERHHASLQAIVWAALAFLLLRWAFILHL